MEILINFILGCVLLMLSGNAITKFLTSKIPCFLFAGIVEFLLGAYFIICCIGYK